MAVRKKDKVHKQSQKVMLVSGDQWILISETNNYGQKDYWTEG